jgi:hypothetical protein
MSPTRLRGFQSFPLAGTEPSYETFLTVTAAPLVVSAPFPSWVIVCPFGNARSQSPSN